MTFVDDIQSAIKTNEAIIGYKESINYIRTNTPKLIIIANNLPINMKKELEHNSKVSKLKLEIFDGTSKELGIVCGKPFPVTTLVIK